MSLFDVIRYPKIDIFKRESLHQLPRPLLEAWAAEITKDIVYPFALDLKNPRNDFSTIAYNTVITAYQSNPTTYQSRYITMKMYQDQFTNLLMKMIAEYDSEI